LRTDSGNRIRAELSKATQKSVRNGDCSFQLTDKALTVYIFLCTETAFPIHL